MQWKRLIKPLGVTFKSWMQSSGSSGTLAAMLHFLLPRVNEGALQVAIIGTSIHQRKHSNRSSTTFGTGEPPAQKRKEHHGECAA